MIAVLTDPAKGGTFLTWSLYFLAGHTNYYHSESKQLQSLPSNPLTELNAHNFRPNQPVDLETFDDVFGDLINRKNNNDVVYFHNFWPALVDTRSAVEQTLAHAQHSIVLTTSNMQPLFECKYQGRLLGYKLNSSTVRNQDWDSQLDDFVDYFYSEDEKFWKESNLNNVWDKREFLALNLRPFEEIRIIDLVPPTAGYYHLDSRDLWTSFDYAVKDLFDHIGWSIDQTRYNTWLPIYQQWRERHYDRVRFGWYFDTIIQSILVGRDMDLGRFNLDIVREAAIQHTIMYQHNLNFKTWGLEKFNNAQQLHQLLEPNIHELNKYHE